MKNLRTLLLVGCLAFMAAGASAAPADVGKKEMCDVLVIDDYSMSFEISAMTELKALNPEIVVVGIFTSEVSMEAPAVTKIETKNVDLVNKYQPTKYRRARDGLMCSRA